MATQTQILSYLVFVCNDHCSYVQVKVQSVKKSARKTPSRKVEEVSTEIAPVAEVSVKKATAGRKRKNVDEISPASPEVNNVVFECLYSVDCYNVIVCTLAFFK